MSADLDAKADPESEETFYYEVTIRTPVGASELIANYLFESGALGAQEEALANGAVLLRGFWEDHPDFAADPLISDLSRYAREACGVEAEVLAQKRRVENWARDWKTHFFRLDFGRHFSVAPAPSADDHERQPPDGRKLIVVEPGMAFGTGHHESTALALLALDDILPVLQPSAVADFGCGSGILSIACKLMGTRRLQAVDLEPPALEEFQRNMALSGFPGGWDRLTLGSEEALDPAPLVIANVTAEVLLERRPRLTDLTLPLGSLLISGIYGTEKQRVLEAYDRHFYCSKTYERNDWSAFWLQKKFTPGR